MAQAGVTVKHTLSRQLLDYLGALKVTQGRLAGEPFPVLPWEKRFVKGAFAPDVVEAGLSVARGNGKTTLTAGIATAALDGPLAYPRAETIIVASSFEQARIAFGHVYAFLKDQHGESLEDKSRWRLWDSANKAMILNKENGCVLRAIGSDPKRAHGLAPVLVLCDEPSQWEPSRAEAMVAALRTSLGKVPNGRLIALGTRPSDEQHWFAQLLAGGADYSQSHQWKKEDPTFARKTWLKANPSLPRMPDLLRAIQREAVAAKKDPAILASFIALRLNGGTSDTVRQMLLDAEVWQSIEGDAPMDGRCYWGIDLGTSAAQSAIAAFWPKTGRLEVVSAFPNEPGLPERGLRDGVADLYEKCFSRGELIQTGGSAVDVTDLVVEARDRFGAPAGIASDRWREAELRDALKAAGLPMTYLELRGQGFKDGGEDVRQYRRGCLEGKVTPLPSLLLASAMGEARTVADPAGNAKLCKNAEGGRRMRARDDAAAAAILAVALASRLPKRGARRYKGFA